MTGGRLLVVTGAAVADVDEVPARVRRLLDTAAEILVVTPILPGCAQWWASDTDRARHEADQRLKPWTRADITRLGLEPTPALIAAIEKTWEGIGGAK